MSNKNLISVSFYHIEFILDKSIWNELSELQKETIKEYDVDGCQRQIPCYKLKINQRTYNDSFFTNCKVSNQKDLKILSTSNKESKQIDNNYLFTNISLSTENSLMFLDIVRRRKDVNLNNGLYLNLIIHLITNVLNYKSVIKSHFLPVFNLITGDKKPDEKDEVYDEYTV